MIYYIEWVKDNPLFSAFVQFALLGTLGEWLPFVWRRRRLALPCAWWRFIWKIPAWGLLGVLIKYGFVGMRGFLSGLVEHSLLPAVCAAGLGQAFALSVLTNLFFGPQMMAFHRLEDNLILGEWRFDGLTTAWKSLIWFWIPAHTITFALPREFQIGLAAAWSIVLGFILGFTTRTE